MFWKTGVLFDNFTDGVRIQFTQEGVELLCKEINPEKVGGGMCLILAIELLLRALPLAEA